jgi:hypothetical protein
MKNNELGLALNELGFVISVFGKETIESQLNIKNKHEMVLVVTSDSMDKAKAQLAYGITKTIGGITVGHYNKHCSRPEFGLVYTLNYASEELMCIALLNHAQKSSQILISLAESNKK